MEQEQQQCVFCHLATGQIPSKTVYEDDQVRAFLDINPATPGHVLVVTKEHVAIMPQMDDVLAGHVGMVAKQLSQALLRALKVEGVSVFVANGAVAGQRAPHFMLHVIPRYPNDGVSLQLPAQKVEDKVMKEVHERLAPVVAKQFGVEPEEEQPAEKKEPEEKAEPEKEEESKEPAEENAEVEQPEEAQEESKEEAEGAEKKASLDDIADVLLK